MAMSSSNRTPVSSPPRLPRSSGGTTTPAQKLPTLQIQSPPITPPSASQLSPGFSPGVSPRTTVPERTASTASTSSTSSNRSSMIGRTNSDLAAKRRGFSRPQGTEFSSSARSRESVMALGSIQHLQYFFAKTGLLDGKGGGLKKKKTPGSMEDESPRASMLGVEALMDSTYSSLRSSPELLLPYDNDNDMFTESPSDDMDYDEAFMLPPTTSTYNLKSEPLPPRPDTEALRSQLRSALAITKRSWEQSILPIVRPDGSEESNVELPQGVHDLHCTELIDLATSAVRAAKGYYYTTDISLLSSKDEKTLREEFLFILDVLKRMSSRNFEGGVRPEERDHVVKWIESVEECLNEEERDIAEMRRLGRQWLEGDWKGKYMVRNHLFMSYFNSPPDSIPPPGEITPDTKLPTDFLQSLRSGLYLIQIHNNVVRRSKRPFGQISSFHTDFRKPYRMADNLRYWRKAAEIRWEVKLKFDVMGVVNGTSDEAWREFNDAITQWCETVLKEVRSDWEMGEGAAAVGEGAQEAAVRKRARTLTLKGQAAFSTPESIPPVPSLEK